MQSLGCPARCTDAKVGIAWRWCTHWCTHWWSHESLTWRQLNATCLNEPKYRATAFATGACTKCTRYGWRRPWHRNRMEWKFGPFASIQTGIEIQGTLQKFLQWVSGELSSAIAKPSQGKTITSGSTTRIITVHLVGPIAFACKEIQIWHVAWENLRVKVLQYVLKKGKEKLSKCEFCEFVTSFHHLKNCIQSASAWHTLDYTWVSQTLTPLLWQAVEQEWVQHHLSAGGMQPSSQVNNSDPNIS